MLQSIWLIIEGFVGIYHTFVNFLMDEIYIYIYLFTEQDWKTFKKCLVGMFLALMASMSGWLAALLLYFFYLVGSRRFD